MKKNSSYKEYDFISIGGGAFGLYAANIKCMKNKKTAVIEKNKIFGKASTINQARIHNGYHYPRAASTAIAASKFFEKFKNEFPDAISEIQSNYYAIPYKFTHTSASLFKLFCETVQIPYKKVRPKFVNSHLIEEVYEVEESAFDAGILKNYLTQGNFDKYENSPVIRIEIKDDSLILVETLTDKFACKELFIATYANTNDLLQMLKKDIYDLKYELCEVALYQVSPSYQNIGLTIMDGPFSSFMPWGKGGLHSLTNVTYTPHFESDSIIPSFPCQVNRKGCKKVNLYDCNSCPYFPTSNHNLMESAMNKYLNDDFHEHFKYHGSKYAVKTILRDSNILDDRPTLINKISESPKINICLSGKIDTMFELEDIL